MIFLRKALATRHSLLLILTLGFILSYVLGANNERIGLSVVSMNALISFLFIGWGLLYYKGVRTTYFVYGIGAIFVFVFLSTLIRGKSVVPLYSIMGNLLLAYVVYKTLSMQFSFLVIVYSFIIFSIPFLTFYIPGIWSEFSTTNRLTFRGMNPNLVAEFISIAFISGVVLLLKEKPLKRRISISILFLLAVIPVINTISRKGILLFFICVIVFYILKYRKWNASGTVAWVVPVLIFIYFLPTFLDSESEVSKKLQYRFSESYEEDSENRSFLILNGISKGFEKPLLGHGMEASRDPVLLKSIGLWNETKKIPINTHNGFVNIFLNGGAILLSLFLFLFFYLFKKMFGLIKTMPDCWYRDMVIVALLYSLIFLAHIMSAGNGELFKLGWFYLGFSAGLIRLLQPVRMVKETLA